MIPCEGNIISQFIILWSWESCLQVSSFSPARSYSTVVWRWWESLQCATWGRQRNSTHYWENSLLPLPGAQLKNIKLDVPRLLWRLGAILGCNPVEKELRLQDGIHEPEETKLYSCILHSYYHNLKRDIDLMQWIKASDDSNAKNTQLKVVM